MIGGSWDEVLFKIDTRFEWQTIDDKDDSNHDATISQTLDELNSASNGIVDEKKLTVMSFCEPDDDNTLV